MKMWLMILTIGMITFLSSTAAEADIYDKIEIVDAWGSGTSATTQNQELYNHGAYGSADVRHLYDGTKSAQGYPASARVGGHTKYDNLWMYVDLGSNHFVDRVDVYQDNYQLYGTIGYLVISTAVDGSEDSPIVEDGGARISGGLWSVDVATLEEPIIPPPFEIQWQGDTGNSEADADEQGEESMDSSNFSPATARYVKLSARGTGYGGFALAEVEVFGIPEPASAAVMGLGGILLMVRRRRS